MADTQKPLDEQLEEVAEEIGELELEQIRLQQPPFDYANERKVIPEDKKKIEQVVKPQTSDTALGIALILFVTICFALVIWGGCILTKMLGNNEIKITDNPPFIEFVDKSVVGPDELIEKVEELTDTEVIHKIPEIPVTDPLKGNKLEIDCVTKDNVPIIVTIYYKSKLHIDLDIPDLMVLIKRIMRDEDVEYIAEHPDILLELIKLHSPCEIELFEVMFPAAVKYQLETLMVAEITKKRALVEAETRMEHIAYTQELKRMEAKAEIEDAKRKIELERLKRIEDAKTEARVREILPNPRK